MVLLRFYSYLAGNGRKWEENLFSDFLTRVRQVMTLVRPDTGLVRHDTSLVRPDTGLVRQIWQKIWKLGKKSE